MPRLSLKADAGVGAIAVSPYSRDVVLASRTGLYCIDIQDPLALPRWLPLRSAWEVASANWCPAKGKEYRVVTSSNQKALVWNLELPSDRAIEHVLHGHRRAVTDTDFSSIEPEMLATSSIDATVKVWDLRDSSRSANSAVITFSDFDAGALQARWDPIDSHKIASSHNNRLVLWDSRKANVPVQEILAHQGECNGINFLPDGNLLSCSTDGTVKLWDLDCIDEPIIQINTKFPVWRVIPTPFELGALVLPLRGGSNSMGLINLAHHNHNRDGHNGQAVDYNDALVATFNHGGPIKDAAFMRTDNSSSQYNIATWCRDQQLRVFDGQALKDLPHASSASGCKDTKRPAPPQFPSFNTSIYDQNNVKSTTDFFELSTLNQRYYQSRTLEHLDWISGVSLNQAEDSNMPAKNLTNHETFEQEILSIMRKFHKIEVFDFTSDSCTISLFGPWGDGESLAKIMIKMKAPHSYPSQSLVYQIVALDDFKHGVINTIEENMRQATKELATHSIPAVEFCIRYLVGDPVSIQDVLHYQNQQDVEQTHLDFNMSDEGPRTEGGQQSADGNTECANDGTDSTADDDTDGTTDTSSVRSFSGLINLEQVELAENPATDIIDTTPLPRTCGAVWALTGKLICFYNKKKEDGIDRPLPLDKVFSQNMNNDDSDHSLFVSETDELDENGLFLVDNNLFGNGGNHSANHSAKGTNDASTLGVLAYDTGSSHRGRSRTITSVDSNKSSTRNNCEIKVLNLVHLWPSRPDVAEEYSSDLNMMPAALARHNYEVAMKHKILDDAYIWKLLINYAEIEQREAELRTNLPKDPRLFFEWTGGTIGLRSLIPAITSELESRGHIQMLTGMSCLFSSLRGYQKRCADRNFRLHLLDASTTTRLHKTNLIDYFEDYDDNETYTAIKKIATFRKEYAQLLHQWGLYIKQAEVLKLDCDDPMISIYQPLMLDQSALESKPLQTELQNHSCSFCMRPIEKLFMHCPECAHALHDNCGKQWWSHEIECPAACGCQCRMIHA